MTDSTQDSSAGLSTEPHQHQHGAGSDGLLAVARNLSQYHREHEKYYSEAALTDAISLQRAARTLIALAERWTSVEPATVPALSPFAGTPDLNDDRAIETSGVLFMEGEGEPAEITRIKSELETMAANSEQSSSWLASAMEASWGMAEALLSYPQLADLLAERHKIIGNNWQNASTTQLIARYLRRAVSIMQRVDFSPAGLRSDLAGERSAPRYLYSAAELINHAADLSAASAGLARGPGTAPAPTSSGQPASYGDAAFGESPRTRALPRRHHRLARGDHRGACPARALMPVPCPPLQMTALDQATRSNVLAAGPNAGSACSVITGQRPASTPASHGGGSGPRPSRGRSPCIARRRDPVPRLPTPRVPRVSR